MSKRGLTIEEKKTKMMELFHEKSEFFTAKELERIASKQKGIVEKTVKDVLLDVVSEGKVKFDKIGTGTYYWAFTSDSLVALTRETAKVEEEHQSFQFKIAEVSALIVSLASDRADTPERRALLPKLEAIAQEKLKLKIEGERYKDLDPVKQLFKQKAISFAKSQAINYTDATAITVDYGIAACQGSHDRASLLSNAGILDEEWFELE